MARFIYSSIIPASVNEVFGFHEAPGALERLIAPWMRVRVVRAGKSLQPGTEVELTIAFGPFERRWVARHTQYARNQFFVDEQIVGPFRRWIHTHRFEPAAQGTRLTDEIDFSLPGGVITDLALGWAVKIQLKTMFHFRHAATRRNLARG